MPKIEIDYSNTIIYKITCKDPLIKDIYIGHTTNFVQRKHAHKQSCINVKNHNYKLKLYEVIRANGGWNNWKMEIIDFFNLNDHYEARQKEQEYYVSLIFEIKDSSAYVSGHPAPVLVDSTRKMSNRVNPIILERKDIEMHHGSYIRTDIRKKLINSSAKNKYFKEIDKIVNHYNNWAFPNKILWAGKPLNVKKVNNLFL